MKSLQGRILKKAASALQIAIFIGWLVVPVIAMWFTRPSEIAANEKRSLASRPEIRMNLDVLNEYPRKFDEYLNDQFGFRQWLIHKNQLIDFFVFRISPTPSRVTLGKDYWLFYSSHGTLRDYQGLGTFEPEILALWDVKIRQVERWHRDLGSQFLFAIAPNKSTVYEEHLPSNIVKRGPSRFHQLLTRLNEGPSHPVLDLRPALDQGKLQHPTYGRSDTHWNSFGSYCAYLEIMNHLAPGTYNTLSGDAVKITKAVTTGHDLTNMIGLQREFEARFPELEPQVNFDRQYRLTRAENQVNGVSNKPLNSGRLLMIHDSFGGSIIPYFARSFAQSSFVWQRTFDPKFVTESRPNWVVHLLAERHFIYDFPVNADESSLILNDYWKNQFDQSIRPVFNLLDSQRVGDIQVHELKRVESLGNPLKLYKTVWTPDFVSFKRPSSRSNTLIFHCLITVPESGELQLGFQLHRPNGKSKAFTLPHRLVKGRNDVYIGFPEVTPNLDSQFTLGLKGIRGRITIHEMAFR